MSYKIYYENNRHQILERKEIYYDLHKEKLRDKQTQYYTINRTEILQKNKRKLLCGCGSVISFGNYTRHLLSNKHQNFLNMEQ